MDEPTKHRISTRERMLTALTDFDGAVILVAHDRSLGSKPQTTGCAGGGRPCQPLEGDLDDNASSAQWRQRADAGEKTQWAESEAREAAANNAEKRHNLKPLKDK